MDSMLTEVILIVSLVFLIPIVDGIFRLRERNHQDHFCRTQQKGIRSSLPHL